MVKLIVPATRAVQTATHKARITIAAGANGPRGATGPDGPDGPDGPAGPSASDVVHVATGKGSITIPSLAGSVDALPASPSSFDQEFDELTGWTTLGALDIVNVTDVPSHLRVKVNASGAYQVHGVYRACPTMPFTVTWKLVDYLWTANYQHLGLMLLEAVPGKLVGFGELYWQGAWGRMGWYSWTNRTTRAGGADADWGAPQNGIEYFRLIVASATDMTFQGSRDGRIWTTFYANVNPGLVPANFGPYLTGHDGNVPLEAVYDWIRFS